MGLALLCAGQGSQHPAMFQRLAAEPAASQALELGSQAAGLDLRELADSASGDDLTTNRMAQLLVVTHALGAAAALADCGVEPTVCAGYSVGELAAHCCAGSWSASTAIDVTSQRAALMDTACDAAATPLSMAALVGLSIPRVERLAAEHGCEVAIINGPDHVVLGGPAGAVQDIVDLAPELGARHVKRLPVQVASHTHFIDTAVEPFAGVLREADWRMPQYAVLSGLDGRPVREKPVMVSLLSRQIGERLDWGRCLECVVEHGATAVLEIGPGRALARMVQGRFPHVPARSFEDFRSAAGAARWASRQA
ncbi:[acyl-carrier-protein] S-malonyltransferase [Natronocella acetinitrilica]|uniref:[acyl-carrier-protein] S-malonyltransferase n=1 Tax=Natronocella acetinitrilica TaxID=414046 RepID=A0AAE3KAE0_9GAMM|nr:malonate decarboxylase subunit epsilon [Natronocella acetinitrilica]MCP1673414.1 [acyl-carrier-protein] S-malonyltransferase [Natronocella acetinitrilica]